MPAPAWPGCSTPSTTIPTVRIATGVTRCAAPRDPLRVLGYRLKPCDGRIYELTADRLDRVTQSTGPRARGRCCWRTAGGGPRFPGNVVTARSTKSPPSVVAPAWTRPVAPPRSGRMHP